MTLQSTPFFVRFLEGQAYPEVATGVKAGGSSDATKKYPSDTDEAVTMKYPSDGDDNPDTPPW